MSNREKYHSPLQSDDTLPPGPVVTLTRRSRLLAQRRQGECRRLLGCVIAGFVLGAGAVWLALELAVRAMS